MDPEALRKKIAALLGPVVNDAGYDLILVEWGSQAGKPLLRLYVDRLDPEDSRGITLNDCATLSRRIGPVLDVEDLMRSAYSLEVSSPGIDRPLVRPDHFRRFLGHCARIRLGKGAERRRFKGTICAVSDLTVTLDVDGEKRTFALDALEKANLVGDM